MKSTALPPSLLSLPLLLIAPFPLDNLTMFLDREGLPSHGEPNQRDEQIQPSSLGQPLQQSRLPGSPHSLVGCISRSMMPQLPLACDLEVAT